MVRELIEGAPGKNKKYGPMRLIWNRWGKEKEALGGKQWIGATIVLREEA